MRRDRVVRRGCKRLGGFVEAAAVSAGVTTSKRGNQDHRGLSAPSNMYKTSTCRAPPFLTPPSSPRRKIYRWPSPYTSQSYRMPSSNAVRPVPGSHEEVRPQQNWGLPVYEPIASKGKSRYRCRFVPSPFPAWETPSYTALYPPRLPPPCSSRTTPFTQSCSRYGTSRIVSPCGSRSHPRAP